ncbi:hypothetical protein SAMN02982989_0989 [Xaviernesmea oryzae]|uniref:Transposase n=1 Tax=Xaviernesmea oryzae TaxID=464029 RepID=A0A1X7FWK9_9HYPH|nr:hypothetical protein [Xaviernesmea oryzae]SMF59895.1 hypothetical protein SAMN02982989_0989 [Xaviernesmea oryzae]
MSTKMTEKDWVVALEVFLASLPHRGNKGRDDRLFLEAMHYFSVHNTSCGRCRSGSANGTASGNASTG